MSGISPIMTVMDYSRSMRGAPIQIDFFETDYDATYRGYLSSDGKWIIKKDNGSIRYSKGGKDFAGNWTGRAALTYYLVTDLNWSKW